MGAIARAMAARRAAAEAAYQPIAEPTQAKEIAVNNSDNDPTRQTRQSKESRLVRSNSQATDLYNFKLKTRQLDELDGGRELDKVKAGNDELEANQADTTSGLTDSDNARPTGNVVIREVNGINIPMPEHYSDGSNLTFWSAPTSEVAAKQERYSDADWIQSMLLKLPASKRKQVSMDYSTRYKTAYDAEPDKNKKANKAALTANSWLRSNIK